MARRKAASDEPSEEPDHRVVVRLDAVLAERGMTLAQLSREIGVSAVNLSVLKNGHARAIRFSTLTAICDALECTPGDLLGVEPAETPRVGDAGAVPPPARPTGDAAPATARRPAVPPPPRG